MNCVSKVLIAVAAVGGLAMPIARADVGVPAVVNLSWTPNHVPPGGITQIRLDIGNPGTTAALTGVAFDVSLPPGLSVNNIGATPIACGTVSAVSPSTIHYTGGTIPANTPSVNSTCNFEINITTSTEGIYTASTTAVTSNEGGAGSTSSAALTVGSGPSISQVFGAASIPAGTTTSLTYTISNSNTSVSATGVGFTNSLPAGLVVASPNGLTNSCGGTATAVAGSSSIQLSGASIAASSSCTVSATVTGTTTGVKNNSVQVTSTNLGNGNTSNTSLTVTPASADLAITKTDGVTTLTIGGAVTYTITASNAGPSSVASATVSDTLPAVLTGATWTCVGAGGGTCTASGSGNISDTVGLPAGASVTYTVSATVSPSASGSVSNTATVSSATTDPNPANNSATDTDSLTHAPAIPTLSEMAVMLLAFLVVASAFAAGQRRS